MDTKMVDNGSMDMWDRVKAEIRRQKTTQEWLSRETHISLNTLKGWISKEIVPNANQAVAIAEALGVTVEYIVTGRDKADQWIRKNRQIIDDLRTLPPDKLEAIAITVATFADQERAKLRNTSVS